MAKREKEVKELEAELEAYVQREIWMMTPREKSFLKNTVFLGQTAIAKRPNQSLILQFVLQIMPKHRSKWSCNTEESSVLVQMKSLEDWTSERGMSLRILL